MSIQLNLTNISVEFLKKWSEKRGFVNCSFGAISGDIIAIIGESGCGKSTLLNTIAGFLVEKKSTRTGNLKIRSLSPFKRQDLGKYTGSIKFSREENFLLIRDSLSYLPQDRYLFEDAPILDNLRVIRRKLLHKLDSHDEKFNKYCEQLINEVFKVPHSLNTIVASLSGGEKQRVAIARTFLIEKELIILLDEPFHGIDYINKRYILDWIKKFIIKTGSICLVVSHDIHDLIPRANKFLVFLPCGGKAKGIYNPLFFETKESFLQTKNLEIMKILFGANLISASICDHITHVKSNIHITPLALNIVDGMEKEAYCLRFKVVDFNIINQEIKISIENQDLMNFISSQYKIKTEDVSILDNDIWVPVRPEIIKNKIADGFITINMDEVYIEKTN